MYPYACVCVVGLRNDEDVDDDDDGIAFFIIFSWTNFFLPSPSFFTLLVGRYVPLWITYLLRLVRKLFLSLWFPSFLAEGQMLR